MHHSPENWYVVPFLKKIHHSPENWYVGKSVSELQIQVATCVFELSAGNCHR